MSADLNERALAGNSNNKYQCKSNCTKIKHIKDSLQVRKCIGRGVGGVWVRIRVFFFFFFFSYVWVCVSVLFPRIEPVGKPYREVCLRSELWPWMAHQPNSWSKHPGTRIEQVLAYCREEQKYSDVP